jgi:hypothetical protein
VNAPSATSHASVLASLARWRAGRKIFVSYRRADTQEIAEQLYSRLALHFGATNVFMDRADIEHGQRWRDEVTRQITAADMFLVLIGRAWLDTLRIRAAADDVLRTELASALQQKKQIIPILVDGAAMPSASELPPEVRGLTEFQALPVTGGSIDRAMLSLLGRLKPGWRLAVSWGFGQLLGWFLGTIVLIGALGAYGWMKGGNPTAFAEDNPFLAGALAGILAGACVAAPQWLVLRPWFARARYLIPLYALLGALGVGYAASLREDDASNLVLGLVIILLPIACAVTMWWVVSEKLLHAGWWSTANFVAPLIGFMAVAASQSLGQPSTGDGASLAASLVVLAFFLPMIGMSIAAGALLVWLMRRSEIRRR